MDSERHVPWKPDLWPTGGCELLSLTDDEGGLRIVLECYGPDDSKTLVQIAFFNPMAYRTIDEGFRLKQWDQEWELTRSRDHSVVYLVEGSSFLNDFHDLSLRVLDGTDVLHYFIVTNNLCVDVIAGVEPEVSIAGSTS